MRLSGRFVFRHELKEAELCLWNKFKIFWNFFSRQLLKKLNFSHVSGSPVHTKKYISSPVQQNFTIHNFSTSETRKCECKKKRIYRFTARGKITGIFSFGCCMLLSTFIRVNEVGTLVHFWVLHCISIYGGEIYECVIEWCYYECLTPAKLPHFAIPYELKVLAQKKNRFSAAQHKAVRERERERGAK